MMADINLRPGETLLDDPHITKAMDIYDALNPREQREIFRSVYRAATAFNRTGDIEVISATFTSGSHVRNG
ncbi:hypothetical protein [Streptosporangium sp. NPDC049644]|uniref:hypothetical protein n=1 Tax=Streptosporangium sp. NPDC049644 TaxID=3155507 RepID=UPI00341E82D2